MLAILAAAGLASALIVSFALAWWYAERDVNRYCDEAAVLRKRLENAEADNVDLRRRLHEALSERAGRNQLRRALCLDMPTKINGKRVP
jgi:hypothetical protein